MYYTKKETYSFSVPKEYKAYLAFRDKLLSSGAKILETSDKNNEVIELNVSHRFNVDDNGEFTF